MSPLPEKYTLMQWLALPVAVAAASVRHLSHHLAAALLAMAVAFTPLWPGACYYPTPFDLPINQLWLPIPVYTLLHLRGVTWAQLGTAVLFLVPPLFVFAAWVLQRLRPAP